MIYKNQYMKILATLFILCINLLFSTQVQLITAHKKSNGVLLRIVTNSIVDIENIAGWKGQENWFYLTLNGSYLSPKALEDLSFELPLLDIEITENNQSVQIGYLFSTPIEDFEIFHSSASRVLLVQVWESLSDSLRSQVKLSEGTNANRVFTLPKQESKGNPFYDSFVYARNKYGPEKYFVWYNNWYSTEDKLDFDGRENKKIKNEADIWEKHWSGNSLSKENTTYGPKLPLNSQQSNNADKVAIINKEPKKPANKPKTVVINENSKEKIKRIEEQILKRKNASSKKEKIISSDKKVAEKQKVKPRRVIKKSSEDLAAYAIEPNLNNRKTFLKIGCDLVDVNVYLDGRRVGKTPLTKRLPVSAGWHRIRIDVPGAKKFNKSGIPNPDFRDVYVTKGRTQKVTFKFLNDQEEPG